MTDMTLLTRRLLEIEEPLFAVLDGAQFEDLPSDLFDGDFVHRPLYRNDNIGNKDQIRTTPQLVWLDRQRVTTIRPTDRRDAIPDGKPDAAVLTRLLALVGERPAAVFWQCPSGADVLYRHLRGINMVLLPRTALPIDEQPHVSEDHAPALFRHADANVMAQVFDNISGQLAARLMGPSNTILFKPDPIWWNHGEFAWIAWTGGPATGSTGLPVLSEEDINNIEHNRKAGLRRRAVLEFTPRINGDQMPAEQRILDAFDRAEGFDLQEFDDIWKFIEMDATYGYRFERSNTYSDAAKELGYTELSAAARLHYAENACKKVSLGEMA